MTVENIAIMPEDLRRASKLIGWSLEGRPASYILRAAIADLRRVDRSRRFQVDMAHWYDNFQDPESRGREVCHVCMAGALLAMHGGLSPRHSGYHPDDLGNSRFLSQLSVALDEARTYDFSSLIKLCHPSLERVAEDMSEELVTHLMSRLPRGETRGRYGLPHYHESKRRFYRMMTCAADWLEERGL